MRRTMLENLLVEFLITLFFCSLFLYCMQNDEMASRNGDPGIICCSWRRSYWYWMIWNYHKTHAAMTDVSIQHSLYSIFFSSFYSLLFLFCGNSDTSKSKLNFPLVRWQIAHTSHTSSPFDRRNLNAALNICRCDVLCLMWYVSNDARENDLRFMQKKKKTEVEDDEAKSPDLFRSSSLWKQIY